MNKCVIVLHTAHGITNLKGLLRKYFLLLLNGQLLFTINFYSVNIYSIIKVVIS